MTDIKNKEFEGERSLFALEDAKIENCRFFDGESPLKESKNIIIENCVFEWKYPCWYSNNVVANNITLKETARSGIWYTNNIEITDSTIEAPKTFRRGKKIFLKNVKITNALETLWRCDEIKLHNVTANGDYFGFNSSNIEIENLILNGNYAFDGGKNIRIKNSILNSKDAFWNCENIVVIDSTINGEYLAWNSKNITFIRCKIISHQGICYSDIVKLEDCEMIDSDLTFEYCSNIKAKILTKIDSIKNPYSGEIICKSVDELILDDKFINPKDIKIITE